MPIRITVEQAVTWGAEQILGRQNLTEQRKAEITPATKYNLLVKVFNSSTVLLATAVASAALLAFAAAATFALLAISLRYLSEKELTKYTLPRPAPAEQPQGPGAALWGRLRDAFNTNLLRHALHQATDQEKTTNIFHNVNMAPVEGWNQDEVFVFDFAVWKNQVPEAPVLLNGVAAGGVQAQQQPQPPQANQEQQAPLGAALGGFINLARRAVAQQQAANQPPA